MPEESFRIVTDGQITTGFDQSLVESNLAKLCKFSPEKITHILSGKRVVLKSGINRETAKRYLNALASTGLVCTLESIPATTSDASTTSGSQQQIQSQRISAKRRMPSAASEVKYGFPWAKYLLLLMIGGFCVIGAFAFNQIPRGFSPAHLAAEAGFEYVEPPDQPPVMSRKENLTVAEILQFYALLESRQYAVLNENLETIRNAFEQNPDLDFKIISAFMLFCDPYLPHREFYDEWVAQYPDHYASYLARATYFLGMGGASRGGKWASETNEEQFAGMHYFFELALADYESALKLNPRLLPAYVGMINICKSQGARTQLDVLIRRALEFFPSSYQLYKNILIAMLPRWGGSYAQMTDYAHQANKYAAENPDMPLLFGKTYMDMAWYANRAKQYQKAIDLYTHALSYGVYEGLLEARGKAYEKIDDWESAFDDYERAIEVNPEYVTPYRNLADIYMRRGDFYSALSTIEKGLDKTTHWDKIINCWYGEAIQNLIFNNNDAQNDFIDSINHFHAAKKAKPYPAEKPLKRLDARFRFTSPAGTKPYGLAWHQGALYLSSFVMPPASINWIRRTARSSMLERRISSIKSSTAAWEAMASIFIIYRLITTGICINWIQKVSIRLKEHFSIVVTFSSATLPSTTTTFT